MDVDNQYQILKCYTVQISRGEEVMLSERILVQSPYLIFTVFSVAVHLIATISIPGRGIRG